MKVSPDILYNLGKGWKGIMQPPYLNSDVGGGQIYVCGGQTTFSDLNYIQVAMCGRDNTPL